MVDAVPERIPVLEERVARLEHGVTAGLERIENIIRQEIQDLKSDQLKDIKASIDRVERDLKGDHQRLADDQRRLWEAVRTLEKSNNERIGGTKTASAVAHLTSGTVGGTIAAIVAWMLHR